MMYQLNETVTLKKSHACGGNRWEIVRLGADVKLRCQTCGRFINVTRDELKKREKPTQKTEEQNG
jgi:hypothetical protein